MTTHVARLSGLIATTLLLAIGWSPVYGADIKERTIKLPVVTAIDHPLGIGTLKFKELIEQKSDGKIKARVFPNGTLGGEVQIISSLQGGTIEASIVLPANLAGLSGSFAALDFPYVFDSERHAAAVLDGPVGARLAEALPEKGLIGLGFMESGFRHYTNSKHPITKVEDMSGLKMRSLQSSIFIDFANALGANAVPLSFTELYSALETGAVDGQENTYATIENSKFDEVQKYLSETRHVYAAQIILVSGKLWNQLSADEKNIFAEAAREAVDYQREAARESDRRARDVLKSRGMQVNELPIEELAKFRERAKPVIDKHAAQLPEDFRTLFFGEVERLRAPAK
jgi:tripartite ATP-independent transporter DctP family solute receptor